MPVTGRRVPGLKTLKTSISIQKEYIIADLTAKVIRIGCDAIISFINFSEGASSAPVSSSQCYQPTHHHKQLIPQNFQLYGLPVDCFGSKRTSTQACARQIQR